MIKSYKNFLSAAAATACTVLSLTEMKAQITVQTFSYTGSIGTFTVPACVSTITMDLRGAQGGFGNSGSGGLGARMTGVFTVTPGQVLRFLVGQSSGNVTSGGFTFPGGGGGSYVANGATVATSTPMIVAGGGGYGVAGDNAPVTTSGTGGSPGINGNGAPSNSCGGGGFFTSGGNDIQYGFFGGQGFQQGGAGGGPTITYATSYQPGGFGGGTAANYIGSCNLQGGNGGGYSGGSGYGTSYWQAGTAGGSFNAGTNQANTPGFNTGHGSITFSYVPGVTAVVVASPTAICSGSGATLTTATPGTYTWFPGSVSGSSVFVSPTTTTSYSAIGTTSAGCTASAVIVLPVSPGVPVMTINSSTTNICLGKTLTLTASGAFTYTWSNGVINGVSHTPSVSNVYTVTGGNGCGTSTAVTSITVAPLPVSIVANPSVVCSGSASTLIATAAATSFSWFPTTQTGSSTVVAPLNNTNYTLVATDGTCSGTQTFSIGTKVTPTITTGTNFLSICQGETVTLVASGAGSGGSYSWTPSGLATASVVVSPTVNTLYSVVGTNSVNCNATAQMAVNVLAAPALNVTATKTLMCAGQTVTLTASGAGTYSWTGGPNTSVHVVSPSAASTTYTVMAGQTSNTCTATKTVAVNAITAMVNVSPSVAICNGQTATLTASGATSYTWTGFTGNLTGSVSVSPTASTPYTIVATTLSLNAVSQPVACTASAVTQVIVNANPTVSVVATRSVICKSETNTLTANGAASYSWNTTSTATSIVVNPTVTTIYTVTGVSASGCVTEHTYQAKVSSCNGIADLKDAGHTLNVYPNPNNGEFIINSDRDVTVHIYNAIGQQVRVIAVTANQNLNVQVKDLSAGIYFLTGENESGAFNQKLIISK